MSLSFQIPYKTDLHKRVKEAILARKNLSETRMKDKHTKWKKSEDDFQVYIPETEANQLRSDKRETGVPQYTTIEIPYSYAILLTAHTYWSSVFLSRTPVLQFLGRHDASQDGELAVEAIMDYQVFVGRMLPALYVWILDAGKYGLGVLGSYWSEEMSTVSSIEEVNETYLGIPIPGKKKKVRQTRQIAGYTGNRVFNVRPYNFLPDPRVPISDLQKGEFCGRITEVGWNEILRRAQSGFYFNENVIKRMREPGFNRDNYFEGSSENIMPGDSGYQSLGPIDSKIENVSFVKVVEMYIELVPDEWGLGTTKHPEKWFFALANDEVIICARPCGSYHNQFPYYIQEYEIDGYQLAKRSMLDVTRPLNDILTWLFDTHFQNVRKVINDQIIIDPSKLVMKDVLDPKAGRLWRLRPEAYGTDPRMSAHQLQVTDVTQNHVRDANVIADLMQRVTGVTDNIMGMVNPGGRKTATEVRSSNTLGVNRLKTVAEYNSALGWGPMSQILLQETQQRYDLERMFRIAGSQMMSDGLPKQFVNVSPELIQGFYDFVPVDGTMPIDRFAMANLMREIMVDTARIPTIAGQMDYMRIIDQVAALGGWKNFGRFKVNVRPDGALAGAAQAGNVVPIGGANAGGTGTGTSQGAGASKGAPRTPQLAGVGPLA